MTKRHATMIQHAYRDILVGISDRMSVSVADLDRDQKRLSSAIEDRGLRFFTIDLVDAGKHFDLCLAASRLTRFGGPHMRPFKKDTVIPRLFKGLLLRVFDNDGCLRPVPCVQSIRYLRQLYFLAKKLKIDCEKERTIEAVQSFFRTDAGVLLGDLEWGAVDFDGGRAFHLDFDDKLRPQSSGHQQLTLDLGEDSPRLPRDTVRAIHYCADSITSTLGSFEPLEWASKHGPGAVSDRVGKSKYDFPTWPMKLDRIFPLADFAYANYGIWADEVRSSEIGNRFSEREAPSKLIAVPKTQKTPRLIASEPTAHQWCQQVIKDFLYDRVGKSWMSRSIHFNDQTLNQRLARQASQTQSHWTIDLSEASDRVSCYVVERFFRKNPFLLEAFNACRTQSISNSIDRESPKLYQLRKFSCMGSALTFPIQSIIFLGVILGSMLSHRRLEYSLKNVKDLAREVLVFGDDLIVPADCGHLILGSLRYLGFKVNRNKTFGTGEFRESCGGEYFRGHDVTPAYLLTIPSKHRPESLVSSVETHNNFYRKGYWRLAENLKSTVEGESYIKIPTLAPGSGLFCWESFDRVDVSGLRSRFNTLLHRREYLVHAVEQRITRHPDRYGSRILQYFTEDPSPLTKWEGGVCGRPTLRLKRRWVPIQ